GGGLRGACRGGRPPLIAVHEKRGPSQAGPARPGPVSEGDLRVDQFLNVVLTFAAALAFAAALVTGVLVIVFVVLAIPVPVSIAFIGRDRTVRHLAVSDSEKGLTAYFPRAAPHHG